MSRRDGAPVKILLVGPCPPPHGGISVHVASARRLLTAAGVRCEVVDLARSDGSRGLPWAGSWLRRLGAIRRRALGGWTVHFHTNGHNPRSWLVALAAGLASARAPGRVVTLHSGMVPAYLAAGGVAGTAARALARLALARYDRVVAVNPEIRGAVVALGVPERRTEVMPAYLPPPPAAVAPALPERLESWLDGHRPVISTALFFRPEYGFDLLVDALVRVEPGNPGLGCLVLGSGEDEEAARRRLEKQGLDDWVLLAGDLPHDLCLALMARSDLFVRPTLADGDALSVREALALGVPVVASDVGVRPPGVARFRAGSVDALVAAVEAALGAAPGARVAPAATAGGADRLLRAYGEVTA